MLKGQLPYLLDGGRDAFQLSRNQHTTATLTMKQVLAILYLMDARQISGWIFMLTRQLCDEILTWAVKRMSPNSN